MYLFVNDPNQYSKLDSLFLKNEITSSNISYWKSFKKMYLKDKDFSPEKSILIKSNYKAIRQYSTTSIASLGFDGLGKTLMTVGMKLGAKAPAVKAPAAASKLVFGKQGITAMGSGAVYTMAVGGALVLTGVDQVI